MAKDGVIPRTMFRVELENKHIVLATISGKMRKNYIASCRRIVLCWRVVVVICVNPRHKQFSGIRRTLVVVGDGKEAPSVSATSASPVRSTGNAIASRI